MKCGTAHCAVDLDEVRSVSGSLIGLRCRRCSATCGPEGPEPDDPDGGYDGDAVAEGYYADLVDLAKEVVRSCAAARALVPSNAPRALFQALDDLEAIARGSL